MTYRSIFRHAMLGARAWFLVSSAIGLSVIAIGTASGISSHRVYASALLLPFFLAAITGTAAIAKLRHRIGATAMGGPGLQLLVASFGWSAACMSLTVLIDWAAAQAGVLGRERNSFLDSIGMVVVTSLVFAVCVALADRKTK